MKKFLIFAFSCFILFGGIATAQQNGEVSTEWCDNCKDAERDGCKNPCKDEQGVKYFVCLDKCATRRCEMACTPVEDEPEVKAKKDEKKRKKQCRNCRRQASKQCKADCADQSNGRKRAICKKKCVARSCDDACKAPKETGAGTAEEVPSVP